MSSSLKLGPKQTEIFIKKLNKKNQDLKKENEKLKDLILSLKDDMDTIEGKWDVTRDDLRSEEERAAELEEENEDLKKENNKLKKKLKTAEEKKDEAIKIAQKLREKNIKLKSSATSRFNFSEDIGESNEPKVDAMIQQTTASEDLINQFKSDLGLKAK
jgi:chromosome segregation ATPase